MGALSAPASASAALPGAAISLASQEAREMNAAVAFAEKIFNEYGKGIAPYEETQEIDSMWQFMRQCIRTRCRNATGLRARVRWHPCSWPTPSA